MKNLKKSNKNNKSSQNKRVQSEVNRILKANSDTCGCESYTPFIKSFITRLVKEADEVAPPEDFTPKQNANDFKQSLEPETSPDNYDVQGIDPNITADAIQKVHDWASKLDEFAKFLNNPDSQSLHSILATQDRPGSLLKGSTRKASDSITRIAGEISKLSETLNQFVILAPKKQRDMQSVAGGGSGT